jgi:hypothetical protein
MSKVSTATTTTTDSGAFIGVFGTRHEAIQAVERRRGAVA